MEVNSFVTEARDNFQRFVIQHTNPEADDSGVYLETLLAQWLYLGTGIEDTLASYDHFLQVVLAITDGVMQRTLSLDYSGPDVPPYRRYIPGLVDPKRGISVLTRIGYERRHSRSPHLPPPPHQIKRLLSRPWPAKIGVHNTSKRSYHRTAKNANYRKGEQ